MSTMSEKKEAPSVARDTRGFRVDASPFNTIKLELALLICLSPLLWLLAGYVQFRAWVQLMVFAGYGLLGMLWLVIRTRRVAKRSSAQSAED